MRERRRHPIWHMGVRMRSVKSITSVLLIFFFSSRHDAAQAYYYKGCHGRMFMLNAMKEAYKAQIDLIRRGLPKIVVQAEYAWATNQLCKYDPYFRRKRSLAQFYVWCPVWYRYYDPGYRAWYALKYIKFVQSWKPQIHFITFSTVSKLPPLTPEEYEIVLAHWRATEAAIRQAPRLGYHFLNFSFPTNVEILYDPEQEAACREYRRHGPLDVPEAVDAETVLIALLISAVKLRRMGADLAEVQLMIRHFVSFTFNGIRCERHEGANIRIPETLLMAYGAKVGKLYGDIINPPQVTVITKEAVLAVLPDEIHSMTTYNSWGNTEYAKLTQSASVPKIYKSMDTVFAENTYTELGSQSARQLVRQGIAKDWHLRNESGRLFVYNVTMHALVPNLTIPSTTSRRPFCTTHFIYSPRPYQVENIYEHCCAIICDVWLLTTASYGPGSPYDTCCTRCNQAYCPGGVTNTDLVYSMQTEVMVPPFGLQESYLIQLIVI